MYWFRVSITLRFSEESPYVAGCWKKTNQRELGNPQMYHFMATTSPSSGRDLGSMILWRDTATSSSSLVVVLLLLYSHKRNKQRWVYFLNQGLYVCRLWEPQHDRRHSVGLPVFKRGYLRGHFPKDPPQNQLSRKGAIPEDSQTLASEKCLYLIIFTWCRQPGTKEKQNNSVYLWQ